MNVLMEILCTALTVTYATNPYTILLLPKGNCHMCCPYHNDDVKLYMNIPGGPVEKYFDWENGSDWRLLDNNKTTVIYIHGFTEQHSGPAATDVRQAYMQRGEENLIVVDWSILAAAPWYPSAVANTPHAATILAGIIDSLVIRGLPLEKIHVIGFSLGAEIAGLLAKRLTVGKLKRITGLDPALPLYHELQPRGRLAKTDAEFVDVIHTDGGIFGFDTALGHADFFPNGGRPAQPGCIAEHLIQTGKLQDFVACSHNRAWKFFAESVRDPLAFPAYKCKTFHAFEKGKCKQNAPTAYMGYMADPSLRGKFFLDTKSSEPYGLGLHQSEVHVTYDVNFEEPSQSIDADHGLTVPAHISAQHSLSSAIGPQEGGYEQAVPYQQALYREHSYHPGMKSTILSDYPELADGLATAPDFLYPDYYPIQDPSGVVHYYGTAQSQNFPYNTPTDPVGYPNQNQGLYGTSQSGYPERIGMDSWLRRQRLQRNTGVKKMAKKYLKGTKKPLAKKPLCSKDLGPLSKALKIKPKDKLINKLSKV